MRRPIEEESGRRQLASSQPSCERCRLACCWLLHRPRSCSDWSHCASRCLLVNGRCDGCSSGASARPGERSGWGGSQWSADRSVTPHHPSATQWYRPTKRDGTSKHQAHTHQTAGGACDTGRYESAESKKIKSLVFNGFFVRVNRVGCFVTLSNKKKERSTKNSCQSISIYPSLSVRSKSVSSAFVLVPSNLSPFTVVRGRFCHGLRSPRLRLGVAVLPSPTAPHATCTCRGEKQFKCEEFDCVHADGWGWRTHGQRRRRPRPRMSRQLTSEPSDSATPGGGVAACTVTPIGVSEQHCTHIHHLLLCTHSDNNTSNSGEPLDSDSTRPPLTDTAHLAHCSARPSGLSLSDSRSHRHSATQPLPAALSCCTRHTHSSQCSRSTRHSDMDSQNNRRSSSCSSSRSGPASPLLTSTRCASTI